MVIKVLSDGGRKFEAVKTLLRELAGGGRLSFIGSERKGAVSGLYAVVGAYGTLDLLICRKEGLMVE